MKKIWKIIEPFKKEIGLFAFLIILGILAIYRLSFLITSVHPSVWQAVVLLLMIVTIFIAGLIAQFQIKEVRNIEEEKRLVGVIALITELSHNVNLLEDIIEHCYIGGHLTEGTFEITKPKFEQYEKNLILACFNNLKLAAKTAEVYQNLEGCRTIIEIIIYFVGNNWMNREIITNGMKLFNSKIGHFNKQLRNLCEETVPEIYPLIKELCETNNLMIDAGSVKPR